jgi:hypothetical protein
MERGNGSGLKGSSAVKWLEGKKTYIVAGLGVLLALAGAYLGLLSNEAAALLLVTSLGFAGLRSGVTNELAKALVDRAAAAGELRRSKQEMASRITQAGAGAVGEAIREARQDSEQPFTPQRRPGE